MTTRWGEWVLRLTDPDGQVLWDKYGWSVQAIDTDDSFVFVVNLGHKSVAGNPLIYRDAPLVLSFVKRLPVTGEFERYTGGLAFRPGFGSYGGHRLTMVQWHSVLHETESGDVVINRGRSVDRVERVGGRTRDEDDVLKMQQRGQLSPSRERRTRLIGHERGGPDRT